MLTFLNTYFLPALALSALPIIIHILTRHRLREQVFSDLRFLEEIHRRRMRRIRLVQWLIVLLRTLAILFIASAFARPAIRVSGGGSSRTHEPTAVAIMLDCSASMSSQKGSTDCFTYAKSAVRKIVGSLQSQDVAVLGFFDDRVRWAIKKPTRFFSGISAIVDSAHTSDGGTDCVNAITEALSVLADIPALHKEIYIITDFTQYGWKDYAIVKVPENTKIFIIRISPQSEKNAGISSLEFPPQLLEVNSPFDLSVSIGNYGEKAISKLLVSINVDGKKMSQTDVELAGGSQKKVSLSAQVSEGGIHWGYAELSYDVFTGDNYRYFTFRIPQKVRVLIAGEQSTRRLFSIALDPNEERKFFDIREISTKQMESELFTNVDVVVLLDPAELSDATIQRLKTFCSNEGGLIVFPGENSIGKRGSFEKILAMTTIRMKSILGDTLSSAFVQWGKANIEHPIISIFAKTGLPEAKFKKHVSIGVGEGQNILYFENDIPALIEHSVGKGKILVSAFSLDPRWSDLFLSGIFVPLIHRMCQYLASDVARFETGYRIGDDAVRIIDLPVFGGLKVECPGGEAKFVTPKFSSGKTVVVVSDLTKAGIYKIVNSNGEILDIFAVNIDYNEGDLLLAKEEDIENRYSAKILDDEGNFENDILASKFGYELWRICLVLALIMLAGEMVLEKVVELK